MNRDLHNYRESYERGELLLENTAAHPIQQFTTWFKEIEEEGSIREPNAMTLATADQNGTPRARIVLLKAVDDQGFVFYTNYQSAKGRAIAINPKVSLNFFWPAMERQVIVQGVVSKLSEEASTAYFNTRPIDSQLGALTSPQSDVIIDRSVLEERLALLKEEYKNKNIERPAHWGGYIVKPEMIEFWQGRPSRLHDRIRYRLVHDDSWIKERLAP